MRWNQTTLAALLLVLCSCATAPHVENASCDPLPGWEDIANSARGNYLIFGELHGSAEPPSALYNYVCALSQSDDLPVLVAIEFDSATDDSFQTAWDAEPEEFRDVMLANVDSWGRRDDGVASVAMFQMLQNLHRLKSAGHEIDLVAFNGAKDEEQASRFSDLPGQEPHEASQAENISVAAAAKTYAHVVILVGNLHARKEPQDWDGVSWQPMAMKLAEPEKVISLVQRDSGGEAWNCQLSPDALANQKGPADIGPEDILCRDYPRRANKAFESGEPHMALWDETHPGYRPGYDGFFFVGPINASPPVQR